MRGLWRIEVIITWDGKTQPSSLIWGCNAAQQPCAYSRFFVQVDHFCNRVTKTRYVSSPPAYASAPRPAIGKERYFLVMSSVEKRIAWGKSW
jgi:hypothetical protein